MGELKTNLNLTQSFELVAMKTSIEAIRTIFEAIRMYNELKFW